jgi:hypothetical protein
MAMRKTKSQLRAEQIAKLQAEQEAYDRSVKEAVRVAAFARCAAVEELYEMFGVKPESPSIREGKNGPVQVASDKDETKRSIHLVEAIARLVAERDEQAAAASQQQQQQAATVTAPAFAAPVQTMGQRPVG